MRSAYNRKPLRGGAEQQQLAARCGAAVGVLNGTHARRRTYGQFRARPAVSFSGEKSERTINHPEKPEVSGPVLVFPPETSL